jgi:hypothetical protein
LENLISTLTHHTATLTAEGLYPIRLIRIQPSGDEWAAEAVNRINNKTSEINWNLLMIALIPEYSFSTPFQAKLNCSITNLIVTTCSIGVKRLLVLLVGIIFCKFEQ